MSFNTKTISQEFPELIISRQGEHGEFDHVACANTSTESSLVFLQQACDLPTEAAVIVVDQKTAEQLASSFSGPLLVVNNVRLAQAKIKQRFHDYRSDDSEWDAIHPMATVHPTAKLGNGCRVGPNTVVGANCILGDMVIIRANAVVESGCTIGNNSIVNSLANIGYNSQIGHCVIIQAGCIIGGEGYGFAPDNKQQYHRIPHTGNVVIGNDVSIGSNTCIDRGTYGSTIIEDGVKIDNLCHIAHNVKVGENSLLTAQTVIAGSSTIGKRVITSGQTGVLDHTSVADDAVLVQRAGVSEDIPHGGMWAGSPAKPFKEFVRGLALPKKVAKLEAKIKKLEAKLEQPK